MNGFGILLIIGIVMFFLFSRKGGMSGMGCCGGHSKHDEHSDQGRDRTKTPESATNPAAEKVIDLKPDEYEVTPAGQKTR